MLQSFTSFVKETNEKFLDYDAAFVDLENKIKEQDELIKQLKDKIKSNVIS